METIHCTHCRKKLDKEKDIAPKEYPDDKFMDRLAKSQWALFGSGGSLLYLCPECHKVTPILSDAQVDRFVEYIKKGNDLLEEEEALKHKYEKHIDCTELHCGICDGGLLLCTVCRAGERELPTECPGRIMTEDELNAVGDGKIDYKDNKWYNKEGG